MREGADLNPVIVVGVSGEVGAACVTRRNILNAIRATHWVKGTAETGTVGVAEGWRPVEDRDRMNRK